MRGKNNETFQKPHRSRVIAFLATLSLFYIFGITFEAYDLLAFDVSPLELQLVGSYNLLPGTESHFRLMVRDGKNKVLSGKSLFTLSLISPKGTVLCTKRVKSDCGRTIAPFRIPVNTRAGTYYLRATAYCGKEKTSIEQVLRVNSPVELLVTTDKPLYQPGQSIHIRTLALIQPKRKPASKLPYTVTIKNPSGILVWKSSGSTSKFGVATTTFSLAQLVKEGVYTIEVIVDGARGHREISVKSYRLPRFKVLLDLPKGTYEPGEKISGCVSARYLYGEIVRNGTVNLRLSSTAKQKTCLGTVEGKLNDDGLFRFELELPSVFPGNINQGGNVVEISAEVVDGGHHKQKATKSCLITHSPLRITLVPESATLVPSVENRIYVVATYADGTPAKTKVSFVELKKELHTNSAGMALFKYKPTKKRVRFLVEANDEKGYSFKGNLSVRVNNDRENILLRPQKSLLLANRLLTVEVLSSSNEPVLLDVLSRNRVVHCQTIRLTNGKGCTSVPVANDNEGVIELKAYRVTANGGLQGDSRIVYVTPKKSLRLKAKLNKNKFRPGDSAKLMLSCTDQEGNPVQAALGCSIIDEAVYAIAGENPQVTSLYFYLQRKLLTSKVTDCFTRHTPMADLLNPSSNRHIALEQARKVVFALVKGRSLPKCIKGPSYKERKLKLAKENKEALFQLQKTINSSLLHCFLFCTIPFILYTIFRTAVSYSIKPLKAETVILQRALAIAAFAWTAGFLLPIIILSYAKQLPKCLFTSACLIILLLVLWGLRKSAAVFGSTQSKNLFYVLYIFLYLLLAGYGAAVLLYATLTYQFTNLPRLGRWYAEETVAIVYFVVVLVIVSLRVSSSQLSGKRFDGCLFISLFFLIALTFVAVPFFQDNLCEARNYAGVPKVAYEAFQKDSESNSQKAHNMGRIRSHFPETLCWLPEVITDENGRAELDIPLADSITQWRGSLTANSLDGTLGDCSFSITVSQPFFIEPNIPEFLTQHDKLELPIALYNHLPHKQEVSVTLKKASWFNSNAKLTRRVTIPAKNSITALFPIEVIEAGRHKIRVTAQGEDCSDSVERTISVKADGQMIDHVFNGTLNSNVQCTIQIPTTAIKGAHRLELTLYPRALSQVVSGLEKTLKKPCGCFEQTSSTTYPNVLILSYLLATGQQNDKIEKRARELISKGYQRLLTFEAPGGGFSWFGNSRPSEVLTAYGLLEFTDMAKVHPVSSALLERTKKRLLSMLKNEKDHFSLRRVGQRKSAYVLWALAASGERGYRFSAALDKLARSIKKSEDAYFLALTANALIAAKRPESSQAIKKLLTLKEETLAGVRWSAKGSGVLHSWRTYLNIETTALACSALFKSFTEPQVAKEAMKWLICQKDRYGTWGATQSTIQVLRALLLSSAPTKLKTPFHITVKSSKGVIAKKTITNEQSEVWQLLDLSRSQKPGKNNYVIETSRSLPGFAFHLLSECYVPQTKSEPQKKKHGLKLSVDYKLVENRISRQLLCHVEATSQMGRAAEMPLIEIGIPPACQPLLEDLDKLVEGRRIARYEIRQNRLFLYLTRLLSNEKVNISYRLMVNCAIEFKSPVSSLYPYYEPDLKCSAKRVKVLVP